MRFCVLLLCLFTGILAAIEAAKATTDKPSIIKVTTTIGFGSKKSGTEAVCAMWVGVPSSSLDRICMGTPRFRCTAPPWVQRTLRR